MLIGCVRQVTAAMHADWLCASGDGAGAGAGRRATEEAGIRRAD